jgi:hypothetical protein
VKSWIVGVLCCRMLAMLSLSVRKWMDWLKEDSEEMADLSYLLLRGSRSR